MRSGWRLTSPVNLRILRSGQFYDLRHGDVSHTDEDAEFAEANWERGAWMDIGKVTLYANLRCGLDAAVDGEYPGDVACIPISADPPWDVCYIRCVKAVRSTEWPAIHNGGSAGESRIAVRWRTARGNADASGACQHACSCFQSNLTKRVHRQSDGMEVQRLTEGYPYCSLDYAAGAVEQSCYCVFCGLGSRCGRYPGGAACVPVPAESDC
ncbi:hypothetical protein C8T65DRAFT_26288 [Cerioporus squamosus]|nr:hypothetical protein C8T65DRAFT_26288 [Cerioporus squamosus]